MTTANATLLASLRLLPLLISPWTSSTALPNPDSGFFFPRHTAIDPASNIGISPPNLASSATCADCFSTFATACPFSTLASASPPSTTLLSYLLRDISFHLDSGSLLPAIICRFLAIRNYSFAYYFIDHDVLTHTDTFPSLHFPPSPISPPSLLPFALTRLYVRNFASFPLHPLFLFPFYNFRSISATSPIA